MSFAKIAERCGAGWGLRDSDIHIVENGTRLHFGARPDGWQLEERERIELLPRILRFENFTTPARDIFLKARKRAALGGVVSVSMDSYGRCRVSMAGLLPNSAKGDNFEASTTEEIQNWLRSKIKKYASNELFRSSDRRIEEEIAEDLGRHLRRLLGVRPHVLLHFMET